MEPCAVSWPERLNEETQVETGVSINVWCWAEPGRILRPAKIPVKFYCGLGLRDTANAGRALPMPFGERPPWRFPAMQSGPGLSISASF
jgi:hypothetical protein